MSIARDLSGAVQVDQVVEISDRVHRTHLSRERRAAAAGCGGSSGIVASARVGPSIGFEIGTAQWAFDKGQPAGFGTDTLPGSEVLYIPLRAPTQARGRAGGQGPAIAGCCGSPNSVNCSTPSPR